MITSEQIVTEAQKLLGVPYAHYGRSNIGLDCSGLIYMVLNRLGKNIPRTDGKSYTPKWWRNGDPEERLVKYYEKLGFVLTDKPSIGGLILFRLYSNKCPANHCGIIISNDKFIHSKVSIKPRDSKVSIENIEPSYIKRFAYYMIYKDCYSWV